MAVDYNKVCFVIMPFGEEDSPEREDWDDTYQYIIQEAVTRAGNGLKCKRADDINLPGSVIEDVIHDLDESNYVIADLSGPNPNVMYELGIRHSHRNSTILMARTGTKLPFDTGIERTIFYRKDTQKGREAVIEKLKAYLHEMQASPDRIDSPVLRTLAPERQAGPKRDSTAGAAKLFAKLKSETATRLHRLAGDVSHHKFILDVGLLPTRPDAQLAEHSTFRGLVQSLLHVFQSHHPGSIIGGTQDRLRAYEEGILITSKTQDVDIHMDLNWFGCFGSRTVFDHQGPAPMLNPDILGRLMLTVLTFGTLYINKLAYEQEVAVYCNLYNIAGTQIVPDLANGATLYGFAAAEPFQGNSLMASGNYPNVNADSNHIEEFFAEFYSKLGHIYGWDRDTKELGKYFYPRAMKLFAE